MAEETRDLVVRTSEQVKSIKQTLDEFIVETRKHRELVAAKLEAHEAIVNQAKGGRIVMGLVAGLAGFAASFLPHPSLLGK